MLRTATHDDLGALTRLLARANDAPYDLARVAEEKCFGAGVEGTPRVRVFGDFEGVAVTCGKYLRLLAVDREKRRRGIGSALLADSDARIAFAEPGNYLIPGAYDDDTVNFLTRRGWRQTAATHNLEASTDVGSHEATRATGADRERVLAFIEREFGRMWRFEVTPAFDRELPPLFFSDENGAVTGFAAHDVNNRGLGFFGPTGVARAARGRGLGRQLLLASLADLRRLGHERAIIPWTDALEFYAKSCNARPLHRFITLSR